MAKQTGMGSAFWVAGNDIGGDINSLGKVGGGPNPLDFTDITQSGMARLGGERDGGIDFAVYFDPTSAHPVLSALPLTDVLMTYIPPPLAVGSPAASMNSKQVNYDWTRGTDGSLTGSVSGQSNGFGLEWGLQLTAGKRTDTAATVGPFFDNGAGFNFGGQAYFHLFAFAGTSVTIDIQSATTSGGAYATTGLTSQAFTAAPASQRVAVPNNTTINEFLKVVTTGTFTNAVFAVQVVVNPVAGVVF